MQWATIITCCLEDEAASGKAEAAVANGGPASQRRGRRGALPNASATSVTQGARGVDRQRAAAGRHHRKIDPVPVEGEVQQSPGRHRTEGGAQQARHVLDTQHMGASGFHLLRHINVIGDIILRTRRVQRVALLVA